MFWYIDTTIKGNKAKVGERSEIEGLVTCDLYYLAHFLYEHINVTARKTESGVEIKVKFAEDLGRKIQENRPIHMIGSESSLRKSVDTIDYRRFTYEDYGHGGKSAFYNSALAHMVNPVQPADSDKYCTN